MAGTALIVGTGGGLSAALARRCAREGMQVGLAARDTAKLSGLVAATGATAFRCDASRREDVERLFAETDATLGPLAMVVYNASYRVRGPLLELDPVEVERTLLVTCYGGFLVAQAAARRMIAQGSGTILLTGASASVKGYARSAAFAMGKFGLRGLAQSMARELAPSNIHVAHVVIDGGIRRDPDDPRAPARGPDGMLDPAAIADTYWHLHGQPRSAWAWEIELRPWAENF